jgi:hypothetical protein
VKSRRTSDWREALARLFPEGDGPGTLPSGVDRFSEIERLIEAELPAAYRELLQRSACEPGRAFGGFDVVGRPLPDGRRRGPCHDHQPVDMPKLSTHCHERSTRSRPWR